MSVKQYDDRYKKALNEYLAARASLMHPGSDEDLMDPLKLPTFKLLLSALEKCPGAIKPVDTVQDFVKQLITANNTLISYLEPHNS
jgi:hypothetical protein